MDDSAVTTGGPAGGGPSVGRTTTRVLSKGPLNRATLRSVHGYLAVLRKRKWTVVVVSLLVVGLTMAYTQQRVPVYRATAAIIIDRAPPQLLSGVKEVIELGSSNYWAIKDYLRTQYEIIRSREVAERVVDRLNLRGDERFASGGDPPPVAPAGASSDEKKPRDPVDVVLSEIQVEPLKDSLMVYIHAEDADPKFATALANAVAEAYRDHNLETKKRIVLEAQKDLVKMVDRLRVEKDRAENNLARFEREQNIGSLENQQRIVDQRLMAYTAKLNDIAIRRTELEAKLKAIGTFGSGKSVFKVAYASVLENPLILTMKQRHIELQDELSKLKVTYLDKHPKVQAVRAQMRRIERQIRRETRNVQQSIQAEYQEVLDTQSGLGLELDAAKAEERELNRVRSAYTPLVQRRDEAVKFYDDVVSRQSETTLTAQSTMNNVRIHDFAVIPKRPVRPNWNLATAIALLLGLIGGVGFAFLREFLDNTVKSREDIEDEAGITFLGVMPSLTADSRRGKRYGGYGGDSEDKEAPEIVHPALLVHYRTRSFVAERTRNIRTNLLFMMPDHPLKTILVTSANPEEGKTTVSVNVAIAMAQGGGRVLIIDGDLRRPHVHVSFGLENTTGLSTAVIESKPVEEYIQASDVPNLDLMLCGPVPPDPTALLHTARFQDIMAALRERYDTIIIDSPPVLPVTDAMIIANHADGVIVVVKSDQTTRDALALASHELLQVNANILGCVLNDHDVARRGHGHYKYYRNRYYPYA